MENDVATTLPLEVFTQRNFVADFSRKFNFYLKNSKIAFLCHPLRNLGVTYIVYPRLVEKRKVDCLLVLIELFPSYQSRLTALRHCGRILVEIVVFERGGGLVTHF